MSEIALVPEGDCQHLIDYVTCDLAWCKLCHEVWEVDVLSLESWQGPN